MDEELREAEIGVIGSALLLPDQVCGLLSRWGVTPEWFGTQAAREIMACVMPMHAEGTPIDLLTVCAALREKGLRQHAATVEECFQKVPTAAYVEHYVGMLRDGWMARAAREAATEMSRGFEAREYLPKDVVAKCMARLTALLECTGRGATRSSWEVKRDLVQLWVDAAAGHRSAMGLPWPYAEMNRLSCGLYAGLNVLAARPSVGKTMFEGEVVRFLLARGHRVARASLDMAPEPLLARDLCSLAGESLNKMRKGFMTASDRTKMELTLEAMKGWKETILEDRTTDSIVARARALKATDGLDLLTVDYAQLLNVGANSRDNDNVRISKAMASLKEFGISTSTPVLVLSQLSREVEKEGRRPQLSDLRDSGSIEQDATTVTFLYPEPKVSKAWCDIVGCHDVKGLEVRPVVWDMLKSQNGATGSCGLRTHAKYFTTELALWSEEKTPNTVDGWDYSTPGRPEEKEPDLNQYVVARHPLGAVECFRAWWFERLNQAARDTGKPEYAEVRRAVGVVAAVAAMEEERRAGAGRRGV